MPVVRMISLGAAQECTLAGGRTPLRNVNVTEAVVARGVQRPEL